MKQNSRQWISGSISGWMGVRGWTLATALLCVLAGRAAENEDLLRDAVQNDQGFKELGGMLQGMSHEMEMSNVFDGEELARGRRLSTEVDNLHQKEMQAILRALEKSIAETQARTNYLRTAGEGHRHVAETLSRLATLMAPAAENAALQAALDKIRALAANVAPLAKQVEEGHSLRPEQQAAAENYGDQAHSIAKEVSVPEAAHRIDKAGDDLAAKAPPDAKRELDAAIRALQDALEGKSDSLAHAQEKVQDLKTLIEDLRKAKTAASEIAKTTDPNKAADRAMDALVKENDIKERLDAANQKEAATDVAQASDNMQKKQYDGAVQKLDEALKALEAAAKAMEDQIQHASQEQVDALKDVQKLAEEVQKLDALQEKVEDLKAEQAAATDPQAPQAGDPQTPQAGDPQPPQAGETGQMTPQEQQKMEGAMAEAAKEMSEAGQKDAAQDMTQAAADTQKGQNDQAKQDLNKAAQALEKAKQQAEQALAKAEQKMESPPGAPDPSQPAVAQQPSPNPPGPDKPNQPPSTQPPQETTNKEKNEPAGNASIKIRHAETIWHAKLPERERQALLSARKEPYPPQMEMDVKKYYELLAE